MKGLDCVNYFQSLKKRGGITALTAYDYPTAKILSEAKIDIILVGDSLGMVVLGYKDTHSVTMDDMVRHTGAVVRGANASLVVADMPKGSYETLEMALLNAKRFEDESKTRIVKIEGRPDIAKALVINGFEVMGHVGLKPQSTSNYGIRGKDKESANNIMEEAVELEKAGCFSIVLECVPKKLAKQITDILKIPTIGIGAGVETDGQILVLYDLLGLSDHIPSFVVPRVDLKNVIKQVVEDWKRIV